MPRVDRRFAFAGAVTATAVTTVLTPGIASATPASGVSGTVIGKTTILGADSVHQQITIQPGGSTGWQWHDGTLAVYVEQGSVTHNDASCTATDVFSQNTSFVEAGGADNVQIDRNLGTTPVVLDVEYTNPAGSPLAQDAPNPGCGFQ
ncbi:cupin [Catenulispora pinisilvae]|uniref:cupin n=1 Tax=Catenulispora pinisilvae TaxID=2705253 RepID=UPI0018923879|nr:cupin [Catenulispora pinisilvae]